MTPCIFRGPSKSRPRKRVNGKSLLLSRVLWEEKHGPIPDGLWVLHKCDNGRCINVDHFFLGTRQDNMLDMHRKNRHWAFGK